MTGGTDELIGASWSGRHARQVRLTALRLRNAAELLAEEDFQSGTLADDMSGYDYQLCIHKDFLYMRKKQGISSRSS